MRKRPSTAPAVSSRPLRLACAVAALVIVGVSGAQAAGSAPPPGAAGDGYCPLVKNAAAQKLCRTSRQQFYSRNYRAAMTMMKEALAISPKEGIIHVMIARIDVVFNNLGEEERELREAHVKGAPDDLVLPQLFDVLIARNDENRLLSEFPDPAPGTKGGNTAYILQGRAKALLSLGRVDEAAAAMDRSLSQRRDVQGLLDRAIIADRQNNFGLSNKLVDEACSIDPKNGAALLAKLKLIQRSGDAAKTLAFSDKLIALFPDRIDFSLVKIQTLLKLNQDAKARAEVEAILAKVPKSNFGAYYNALLMARANQKTQAWQVILALPTDFVRQNPVLALPIAQIAIDTGHPDAGAGILGNALTRAPDLLEARLRLVELKLSQNSPQSAQTFLTPVKDSKDPRVQKLLVQVQNQIAKDRSP